MQIHSLAGMTGRMTNSMELAVRRGATGGASVGLGLLTFLLISTEAAHVCKICGWSREGRICLVAGLVTSVQAVL